LLTLGFLRLKCVVIFTSNGEFADAITNPSCPKPGPFNHEILHQALLCLHSIIIGFKDIGVTVDFSLLGRNMTEYAQSYATNYLASLGGRVLAEDRVQFPKEAIAVPDLSKPDGWPVFYRMPQLP
jgi:hypothetical protein